MLIKNMEDTLLFILLQAWQHLHMVLDTPGVHVANDTAPLMFPSIMQHNVRRVEELHH